MSAPKEARKNALNKVSWTSKIVAYKKRKLNLAVVAIYTNADHSALGVPELFTLLPDTSVKALFKEILFNAVTGKSGSGDYYQVIWHTIRAKCFAS
ncbi:hypothetical protein [Mucilaginibacter kameinonensis]|uniref:hypothetical protein n=1 Tax=Mucilaginibacter kameinonensis TaxID=452286 RepID=UPI000EF8421A|nr:hypothetical protein [Mucilaginibacter kameinonensis]